MSSIVILPDSYLREKFSEIGIDDIMASEVTVIIAGVAIKYAIKSVQTSQIASPYYQAWDKAVCDPQRHLLLELMPNSQRVIGEVKCE